MKERLVADDLAGKKLGSGLFGFAGFVNRGRNFKLRTKSRERERERERREIGGSTTMESCQKSKTLFISGRWSVVEG